MSQNAMSSLPVYEQLPAQSWQRALDAEFYLYQSLAKFDLSQSKREKSKSYFDEIKKHKELSVIEDSFRSAIVNGVIAAIDCVGERFQYRNCVFFMSYNGIAHFVEYTDSFVSPGILIVENT